MIEILALSAALMATPVSDETRCLLEARDLERAMRLRDPGSTPGFPVSRLETRCRTSPDITRDDIDDMRRDLQLGHRPPDAPAAPGSSWTGPPVGSWERPFD